MNLRLPPLLAACLAALPSVFAAPIPAESSITAATVYADRAVVTRAARVELPAGQTEVVFTGLPAHLQDQSLQAAARGVPAILLDVSARTAFTEATVDPRVKSLEDDLVSLRREDRVLQDQLVVLDQQRALLGKIEAAATQPASGENAAPRPAFEEWQKLMAFSGENAARLATQRQSLDEKREELALRLKAAQARLDELRGKSPSRRATKTVTLRFSSERAGPLDITLAYALGGASWSPAYDARLRSEERAVALTYFGVVRNATGEDWNNVALTLSTARPNLGGGAPELSPWIVDALRPVAESASGFGLSQKPKRPDPSNTVLGADGFQAFNALAPAAAQRDRFAPVEADLALADVNNAATSASFKIAAAATLPSDNSPQKVGIASVTLPATLQYQATPRRLEAAFLGAYTVNSTDFPFLAGPVGTFLDQTFVATSRMKTVMPGEKLQLDLGADEGVSIKRKLVNRFTEDAGFSGKTRRVTYEFLVTVANNKRTAERVVFKDALPVSRDEKVVVKLLAPAEREVGTLDKPGREVTREEDGKLVWRLDLKPGEKREIPLKFSVEHPSDLPVTGLD